jgi:hypothetical protein
MDPTPDYINNKSEVSSRVEAGSNTSTVALRVVGGDEKGSLKSEIVKYGHESHGTRPREWMCWRWPAAIVNDRSVLSSESAPHQQTCNCLTVIKIGCFIPRQAGRLTVGRNVRLRLKWVVQRERKWSESSAVKEEGIGWRLIVSYCNWLWLRQIVKEGVNKANHPMRTPLLLDTQTANTWHFLKRLSSLLSPW